MKIGSRYKIARKLEAPVFEKTQTQKYALSESKKGQVRRGRPRQKSDYALQLREKQRARYFYLVSEKQFQRAAKIAMSQQEREPSEHLFEAMELRLDNVVIRGGLAISRSHARQLVSHGHIYVNGRKMNIPSHRLKQGDEVAFKPASLKKGVVEGLDERIKTQRTPSWLKPITDGKGVKLTGTPNYKEAELLFDLHTVLEFYSR